MSQSLNNIGLTGNYEIGRVGWGDSFNENLEVIDSLLQPVVHSIIDYKPTSAVEGDIFIVSRKTQEPELINLQDYLVVYTKNSWFYIKPKKQFSVYLLEKNQTYVYNERGWNPDNIASKVGDVEAYVQTDRMAVATDMYALAQKVDTLAAKFGDHASATVKVTEQAYANQYESISKLVTNLNASFMNKLNAAINSEQEARANDVEAIAKRVDDIHATVQGGSDAAIKQEQEARATQFDALARTLTTLQARTGTIEATVRNETIARSNANDAMVKTISDATAKISNDTQAAISKESEVRASQLETIAKQVSTMDAKFGQGAEGYLKDESIARANAIEALAQKTSDMYANFSNDINAQIQQESKARSDADSSTAEQMTTMSTTFTKNLADTKDDINNTTDGKLKVLKDVVDSKADFQTTQKAISDATQASTDQVNAARSDFKQQLDTLSDDVNNKITKTAVDSSAAIEDTKKTLNTSTQALTDQLNTASSAFNKKVDDYKTDTDGKLVLLGQTITDSNARIDDFKKTYNDDNVARAQDSKTLEANLRQTIQDGDDKSADIAVTRAKTYADQTFLTQSDFTTAHSEIDRNITSQMQTARNGALSDTQAWANDKFVTHSDIKGSVVGDIQNYDANLIVGGRNYISHSDTPSSDYFWYDAGTGVEGTVTYDKTKYICNLTKSTQITDVSVKQRINISKVTTNNLILSADVLQVYGNVNARITTQYSSNGTYYNNTNTTTIPGRIYQEISLPTDHTDLTVWLGVSPKNIGDTGTVIFEYPQLEIGTKATQWSPNPDDISSQLTANASATQALTSQVKQQGDALTSQSQYSTNLSAGLTTDAGNIIKNSSLIYSNFGWQADVDRVAAYQAPSGMPAEYGLFIKGRDCIYSPNDKGWGFDQAISVTSGSTLYMELTACVQDHSKLTQPLLIGCAYWDKDKNINWTYSINIQPQNALTWSKFSGELVIPSNATKFLPWLLVPTFTDLNNNNWYVCNPVYKLTNELNSVRNGINANATANQALSARVDKTEQDITATSQSLLNLNSTVGGISSDLSNKYVTKSNLTDAMSSAATSITASIEVGGVNRLPITEDLQYWAWNESNLSVETDDSILSAGFKAFGGRKATRSTNNGDWVWGGIWTSITSIPDNTDVVMSVWVYATGNAVGKGLHIGDEVLIKDDSYNHITLSSGWNRYYVKGKWKSNTGNNAITVYAQLEHSGDWVVFARPQLETGTVLTDWSPNPTDQSDRITKNEAYISRVDTAVSNLNGAYSQTSKDLIARVGKAESSISDFSNTYVTPGAVGNLVSSQMSTITSGEVKNQLNGLQIGGTNLLPFTKTFYNWVQNSATFTSDVSYNDFVITKSTNQFNYYYYPLALEQGQTYTISGMVRSTTAGTNVSYYAYDAGGWGSYNIQQANTWEKFVCTFTCPSTSIANHRLETFTNNVLYVCALKLEKGNKATDWSPSDKDTQVGGENLLLDSERERIQENSSPNENYIWVATPTLEPNTNYVLSADIKTEGQILPPEMFYIDWNGTGVDFAHRIEVPAIGQYARYSLYFKTGNNPSSNNTVRIDNNGSKNGQNTKVFAKHFKLEKGTVSTDWSPNSKEVSSNLFVGGTNLQRNGNFSSGDMRWFWTNGGNFKVLTDSIGNYLRVTAVEDAADGIFFAPINGWKLNQTYTLSAMVRNVTSAFDFGIEGSAGGGSMRVQAGVGNGDWVTLTYTSQKVTNGGACIVYVGAKNGSYEITNIKLEEGSIRTSWTPSQWDLNEAEIDNTNLYSRSYGTGAWIGVDGSTNYDTNDIASPDYVSCKEGNFFTFTLYDNITGWGNVNMAFYDTNRKCISGSQLGGTSAFSTTVQAPYGSRYFKISAPVSSTPARMKLEKGSKSTAWSVALADAASGQALDDYKATVSHNYYTKDDTDGNIRTISAGKIEEFSVQKSAGGSNRLKNSDFTYDYPLDGWSSNGSNNTVNADSNVTGYNGAIRSCSVNSNGAWSQGLYRWVNNINPGVDVTLSIWIYADSNSDGKPVGLRLNMGYEVMNVTWNSDSTIDDKGNISLNAMTLKPGWNLYKTSGTWRNNGNCTFYVEFSSANQRVYMSRPMLSVGKLYPDWSPCPDDIDKMAGDIASVKTQIITQQQVQDLAKDVVAGQKADILSSVQPTGVNLLSNTTDFSANWNLNTFSLTNDKYMGLTVIRSSGQWGGAYQNINISSGTQLTASFYVKRTSGAAVGVYGSNINGNIGYDDIPENVWVRKTYTFNTTADTFHVRVENRTTNGSIDVCGLKVELGSKDTGWSANPNDALTIATVNQNISNAKVDIGQNIDGVRKKLDNMVFSGVNLYCMSRTTKGYLDNNGNPTGTANDTCSDYISLPWITNVSITIFQPGSIFYPNTVVCFYDWNKNLLQKWGGAGSAQFNQIGNDRASQTLTPPSGTRYMRASFNDNGSANKNVLIEGANVPSIVWSPCPDDVAYDTSQAVAGIQPGGANLLDNTNFDNKYFSNDGQSSDNPLDGWNSNGSNNSFIQDDSLYPYTGSNRCVKCSLTSNGGQGLWRSFTNPPAGVPIVLSIWARTYGGTTSIVLGNECCNVFKPQTVTGSWTRIVVRAISNGSGNFTAYFFGPQGWDVLLAGPQIEVGTVETPWKPCFRDVYDNNQKLFSNVTVANNSINGIHSEYGVKVNNNGVISGFGTYSDLINGRVNSTFGVNADNFYIGAPSDGKKFFNVNNGFTTIDSAYIKDLKVSSLSTLLTPDGQLGTFSTQTNSGRLVISGTQIVVYDSNGTMRVRLGLW